MRSVESSMRKIWAVVRREFVERVRRRWFWIMALVGPLFFGAVFVLPSVLARGGGVRQIVVVDGTAGPLGRRITDSLNATRAFDAVFVRAGGRVLDSLTTEVEEKRLSGFLILTDATVDSGKAEYRGSNVSGLATVGTLRHVVGDAVSAARLERAIGQFMLDLHTREHGYTEVWVPNLVNGTTMLGGSAIMW